jgi:hypothetical protein
MSIFIKAGLWTSKRLGLNGELNLDQLILSLVPSSSSSLVCNALLKTKLKVTVTSGSLIIGNEYYITTYQSGDDFINVGALANVSGETFIATGTTPTDWSNGSSLVNVTLSSPEITIQGTNTLGAITIDWGVPTGGSITSFIKSNSLFTEDKTLIFTNGATATYIDDSTIKIVVGIGNYISSFKIEVYPT